MARRRKRSNTKGVFWAIFGLAGLAFASWWVFLLEEPLRTERPALTLAAQGTPGPIPTEPIPASPSRPSMEANVPQESRQASNAEKSSSKSEDDLKVQRLHQLAQVAHASGDLLTARENYSQVVAADSSETMAAQVREQLSILGRETILSPRIFEGDPHVDRYVIQPGDTLAKIASTLHVTADLLAGVNLIGDKNLVRAGQTIKIIKGPFDAVVDKKSYTLDLYLGSTLVRSFSVGLGANDGTPVGKWRVSSKLSNPTYHPPRGGRIIAADDPQNPLGERWIGLVGIEGAAIGQERYGIHGTIEPESIGQSTSMGCIRLRNEDVEQLYSYLVERQSIVTVK